MKKNDLLPRRSEFVKLRRRENRQFEILLSSNVMKRRIPLNVSPADRFSTKKHK
jgi:hypothetical protein